MIVFDKSLNLYYEETYPNGSVSYTADKNKAKKLNKEQADTWKRWINNTLQWHKYELI